MEPTRRVEGSSTWTPTIDELQEAIRQKDAEIGSLRTGLDTGRQLVTRLRDLVIRLHDDERLPDELRAEINRTEGFSEFFRAARSTTFATERAASLGDETPATRISLQDLRDQAAAVREKSDKLNRGLDRLGEVHRRSADILDKKIEALTTPGLDLGALLHLLSVVGFDLTIVADIANLNKLSKNKLADLLRESLSYVAAVDNASLALRGVELNGSSAADVEELENDLAELQKRAL